MIKKIQILKKGGGGEGKKGRFFLGIQRNLQFDIIISWSLSGKYEILLRFDHNRKFQSIGGGGEWKGALLNYAII